MKNEQRGVGLAWWAAATIFVSAFLLFQVQPVISKKILPWFGGSPAVWTTCMLFFQVLLLGGYAYAHWLTHTFRPRMQGIIHSMTPLERAKPELIKASRKRRIATGSGVPVQEVNRLLNQFSQMQAMMKKMQKGGLAKMMRSMKGMMGGGMGGMGGPR